jgi:protocatechuate 3,4-dioxygenase alpha subunit
MADLQSPSQTVGPYFRIGLIRDNEQKHILVNDETAGQHIHIVGAVYDGDGIPINDAMVEIWQADSNGIYIDPRDPRYAERDLAFRGFGRAETILDKKLEFHFMTVKPGGRDGLPPYINVCVFARGMLIHAFTRLYFSDEDNSTDEVLSSVPEDRRQTLIAQLMDTDGIPTYRFDIRLQGDRETVFFNP